MFKYESTSLYNPVNPRLVYGDKTTIFVAMAKNLC